MLTIHNMTKAMLILGMLAFAANQEKSLFNSLWHTSTDCTVIEPQPPVKPKAEGSK